MPFARYQDAADHLKQRIGRCCSFCERSIRASLAVEHKLPKSVRPDLERTWDNLLLACSNCNSVKGARHVAEGQMLWPDVDDTFGAVAYLPSGRVRAAEGLESQTQERALNLLSLVGLDRGPQAPGSDHRWYDRLEVWRLASQSAADLAEDDSPAMVRRVADTAAGHGGFSIWMSALANFPTACEAIAAQFPGTVFRGLRTGATE